MDGTSMFHDMEKRGDDIRDGLKGSCCESSLFSIHYRTQSLVQYPPPHFSPAASIRLTRQVSVRKNSLTNKKVFGWIL